MKHRGLIQENQWTSRTIGENEEGLMEEKGKGRIFPVFFPEPPCSTWEERKGQRASRQASKQAGKQASKTAMIGNQQPSNRASK